MTPLLEIRTTPIKLNIHSDYGKVEYTRGSADLQIFRQKGGLSIETKPTMLRVDSFELRNSISPTAFRSLEQYADKGKQAALEACATYAQQGKRAMEAPLGQEMITQFVKEAQFRDVMTNIGLDFIPKGKVNISWDPGYIHMKFEADRLRFDWKITDPHFECSPAHAHISVAQYPDVQITYTGQPMYVPRSANPVYNQQA